MFKVVVVFLFSQFNILFVCCQCTPVSLRLEYGITKRCSVMVTVVKNFKYFLRLVDSGLLGLSLTLISVFMYLADEVQFI